MLWATYFRSLGELLIGCCHDVIINNSTTVHSHDYHSVSSFRSSQSAFYKVLISNAATSALRLHQRLPAIQFTREFLSLLLLEDSCHYLFFSLIFLYVQPVILVLFPVILFAVLHSASYSLKMLDVSFFMFMTSSTFVYFLAWLKSAQICEEESAVFRYKKR